MMTLDPPPRATHPRGMHPPRTAPPPARIRGVRPLRLPFLPEVVSDGAALAAVAAAAVICWPGRMSLLMFFLAIGLLIGYFTYRHRPRTTAGQVLLSLGLPAVAAWLMVQAMQSTEVTYLGLVVLPAASLGAGLAVRVDQWFGRTRKVTSRAWAGIHRVGERTAGGLSFDIRPLTERIPRGAVRGFLIEFLPQFPGATSSVARIRRVLFGIVLWVLPLGLMALGTGIVQEFTEHSDDMVQQLFGLTAVALLLCLGLGILFWFAVRTRTRENRPEDHYRLARFACRNGLVYHPFGQVSTPGLIASRTMYAQAPRTLIVCNYELEGGVQTAGLTHFGGQFTMQLNVHLPHLLLVAQSHRLPAFAAYTAPAQPQRLSLEGDFDRYFELYCPRGYERDALYLFTPDVMATLVDHAQGFDIELRDNQLILRSRADFVTLDPAVWANLADAVNGLSDKIAQWERWRDEKDETATLRVAAQPGSLPALVPGKVALSGRRLRAGIGSGALFALAFIAVYLGLTALANLA